MERRRILVVDDDRYSREAVEEILRRRGYDIVSATDGVEALTYFHDNNFDLVISDMKMPKMSGMELLDAIRSVDKETPFIMITAYGDIESAVEAMQKGATTYIQKSEHLCRELEPNLERALQLRLLINENKRLKSAIKEQFHYIGNSEAMKKIRDYVAVVAQSRSTVLISGESGTGKELVARSIHYLSPRSNEPFVKVNCAAFPEGLIESELFGHEKGAFTGAFKERLGKFELASEGTLLLDEIGEMPLTMQAKMLRVLQEREIHKVGGENPVQVDVRIVATTNRNLEEEIAKGRFREDLYYRLQVFRIHLPPLRDRMEDLELLVEHFIKKYNKENGYNVSGIEDCCWQMLKNHKWPGNIRELENTIERAVVLTRSGKIKPEHLSIGQLIAAQPLYPPQVRVGMTISELEKELILKTLEHCSRNRTKAASMLGISIRTLRNKLKEYNAC